MQSQKKTENPDGFAQPHDLPGQAVSSAWFLAYSKPRQESVAELNLRNQGFEVYLPLFKVIKRGASEPAFEPMFPRYIFLRPREKTQSVSVVRSTRGVMSLVRFGIELASLPEASLLGIRALEEARNRASNAELSLFRRGQSVVVAEGPLKGLEGLVQEVSSKRVVVLLEMLGRTARVGIAQQQLAVA